MHETTLFSIVVVLCVIISILSAKETKENDVLMLKPKIRNLFSVDKAINKEFHCNGSESKTAQANECRCKNGKCMRVCDVKQTVPCLDKKKVCTCSPGYAETDGECQYCGCGQNFGCVFKRNIYGTWIKTCTCPNGYFEDTYYGDGERCKPECSDEQPCRNGGTCSNRRCYCQSGTTGDLCEKAICSYCTNRLEVDCLYSQPKETSYCSCKNSSLFYDYDKRICITCPCENGLCEYKIYTYSKKLICRCNPGYKLFKGYCKNCDCDFNAECEFNSRGEKICQCKDGFFEREGRCQTCDCRGVGDKDTKCKVVDGIKGCFCDEGFLDVLGRCEDINECETNNTCHFSTKCYNTYGGFGCLCPEGYKGSLGTTAKPGEVCEDINECDQEPNGCWFYDYVNCVNLPGSYKCECRKGYNPSKYDVVPIQTICVKSKKPWWPAATVLVVTGVLAVVSMVMHNLVKKRSTHLN